MIYESIPQQDEEIAKAAIVAAIEAYRELGPGFLESIHFKSQLLEDKRKRVVR
ncbi:MAG: hypothetical protein ACLQNE_09650 [Thermoguttaceae bacterium]